MFDKPPRYRSYLLTLWEERSQNPASPEVWRFTLEEPRTGQRRAYAGLTALMAALQVVINEKENRGNMELG